MSSGQRKRHDGWNKSIMRDGVVVILRKDGSEKSHVVVAKVGSQVKTIRFGEQGASTAGKPKAGESERMKMKRKSFKARHSKNIAKGKMSAAYWADKVKW